MATVILTFGQTIQYSFINYDDDQYVYANRIVSNGLTLDGVSHLLTRIHAHNWHPVTTFLHMLDFQLYGQWAGGHHMTNVLLHAFAAVLLFLTLIEMTGALWRSAFVTSVFAIHPLRVESVAWISELKDITSGVFFMLTLLAYSRYTRRPESRGCFAMVVFCFALGLMSKPMLVTLPFVLLLLDYWPLGRFQYKSQFPRLLKEKFPLFTLSAMSCAVTIFVQKESIKTLERLSLSLRLENALVAYVVYIGKIFYPARLAVLYPLYQVWWSPLQVTGAITLLSAVTVLTFCLRKKHPFLIVGWLWYLGMLLPVIGILQVGGQAFADRYTYLPQTGLCIAGTWLVANWAEKWRHRRAAVRTIAVATLGILLAASYKQVSYWRNSISLWDHTLECTCNNYVAHDCLGSAFFQQGRIEAAIAHFREALQINSAYGEGHNNLGYALLQQGKTDEAMIQFRDALRINQSNAEAHNNLGIAFRRNGQTVEAISQYREALKINPAFALAHNNLGNALLQQGLTQKAIIQYEETLQINPSYADAHYNLGNAMTGQGRAREAIFEYREALWIDPANTDVRDNLLDALSQQK